MVFNSYEYLFLFLPIVFAIYWMLKNRLKLQNFFIILVSYFFYGWWDWRYLFLIFFTTICSFCLGIFISESSDARKRKLLSTLNIVINLSILGVFKYYDFFAESIRVAFVGFGIDIHPVILNLILPVGISFYTFQALSYTIDVYRGRIFSTRDPFAFFAFISFFPQLVAGPIERATNLLPQFQNSRSFDYVLAVDGSKQILWGLFKKIMVADTCALYVDTIYQDISSQSSISLILAGILFAFQIYGDFSGYSDIAIGTSKLFGINLVKNFDMPYFSRNIAEFWRRWHISLNKWFVDYIYIPMGGSKYGRMKSLRNTMVVFLLSGLWHGANWTFVLWGLYHAICFIPLLLLGRTHVDKQVLIIDKSWHSVREMFRVLLTFMLVVIGWIIFRSQTVSEVGAYFYSIAHNWDIGSTIVPKTSLLMILTMLALEWINRNNDYGLQRVLRNSQVLMWTIYLSLSFLCLVFMKENSEFIYFQF